MSINENREFEAINKQVKERSVKVDEDRQAAAETYREVKARRRARAAGRIITMAVMFAVAAAGFFGLEAIGWINDTFRIVLVCAAGAVAMFKIGFCWHDLKQ